MELAHNPVAYQDFSFCMSPRIIEENKDAIQFVNDPWDKAMNAL